VPVKPSVPKHWVLDANVLFSEWSLAFVHTLAQRCQAQLYWTPLIEHECFRNLVRLNRLHPEDAQTQQATLAHRLGACVLDGDYSAYWADVRAVDEKDRHVAATALALKHQTDQYVALLTWNVKDFPRKQLLKLGVVRYSLDDLACELLLADGASVQPLLQASAQQLHDQLEKAPPKSHPTDFQLKAKPIPNTREEWLVFLARNRLYRLARLLQSHPC
jgi:hypothetical protein